MPISKARIWKGLTSKEPTCAGLISKARICKGLTLRRPTSRTPILQAPTYPGSNCRARSSRKLTLREPTCVGRIFRACSGPRLRFRKLALKSMRQNSKLSLAILTMPDPDRKKKDGQRKDKKNKAMREVVKACDRDERPTRPSFAQPT